jgi:hypothetical protein
MTTHEVDKRRRDRDFAAKPVAAAVGATLTAITSENIQVI